MILSSQFYLKGVQSLESYQIQCSTGGSIPMGEDGRPSSSTVYMKFYKTNEGVMEDFEAPKAVIQYMAGNSVEDDSYHYDVSSVNIYNYLSNSELTSVIVSLYNDDDQVLAQATFSLIRPTEIELPLTLKINGGDSTIFMIDDWYKGLFNQTINISVWQGDKAIQAQVQDVYNFDNGTTYTTAYRTIGTSGNNIFTTFYTYSYAKQSVPTSITFSIRKTASDTPTEVTCNVEYPGYIPHPVGDTEWVSGKTYEPGDYFILNTDNGNMVYMWAYPLPGNTSVPPAQYTSKPTKWKSWSKWDLVATSVLLADFGLVGKAVFMGDYMMSQQGVDASGNDSTDYTEFPDNFKPNTMIDFVTGDARFRVGEFSGFLRMEPRVITKNTADNPDMSFTDDYWGINLSNLRRGGFIVIDIDSNSYGGDGLRLPTSLEYAGAMVTVVNKYAAKIFKIVSETTVPSGYAGWSHEGNRRMAISGREVDGVKLGGTAYIGAFRVADFVAVPQWPDVTEGDVKYAGNVIWVLKNSQEFSVVDYESPVSRWAENKVWASS